MGKKGDLLRAMKAQRVTYTFTREQLMQHDEAVKAEYRKTMMERVRDEADAFDQERDAEFTEKINRLWNEREQRFKTGYLRGDVMAMASAMMAVAIRVLVEDFGWPPVPLVRRGHRTRLERFAERVVEEMTRIGQDETLDIMRYADEVDEMYGVSFNLEDDE